MKNQTWLWCNGYMSRFRFSLLTRKPLVLFVTILQLWLRIGRKAIDFDISFRHFTIVRYRSLVHALVG